MALDEAKSDRQTISTPRGRRLAVVGVLVLVQGQLGVVSAIYQRQSNEKKCRENLDLKIRIRICTGVLPPFPLVSRRVRVLVLQAATRQFNRFRSDGVQGCFILISSIHLVLIHFPLLFCFYLFLLFLPFARPVGRSSRRNVVFGRRRTGGFALVGSFRRLVQQLGCTYVFSYGLCPFNAVSSLSNHHHLRLVADS